MTEPLAAALPRGIDQFNRGKYFEAHETWEQLWLRERGPLADFYKGLIQCAAALLHLVRGNLAGARQLHERQRGHLARYGPDTLGIALGELRAGMDALFASVSDETRDPRTILDLRALPKIHGGR